MSSPQRESKLFGSPGRTEALILIALLGETYPRELTRLLHEGRVDAQRAGVTYIVDDFEREGVLASRRLGRTRRISLDPRYFAAKELRALLDKMSKGRPDLQAIAAGRRSRPRRKGKEL